MPYEVKMWQKIEDKKEKRWKKDGIQYFEQKKKEKKEKMAEEK